MVGLLVGFGASAREAGGLLVTDEGGNGFLGRGIHSNVGEVSFPKIIRLWIVWGSV